MDIEAITERVVVAGGDTDKFIKAIRQSGKTGNDIKAMVNVILRQAEREDWLVTYDGKEVMDVLDGLLKKRGLKDKRLRDSMSILIGKTILGSMSPRMWSMIADAVDKADRTSSKTAAQNLSVKNDMRTRKGVEFFEGEDLRVIDYGGSPYYMVRLQTDDGRRLAVPPTKGFKFIKGFPKTPSARQMERWMDTGSAKAIDGSRVDPDGYSSSGAPSWLLVLGMI